MKISIKNKNLASLTFDLVGTFFELATTFIPLLFSVEQKVTANSWDFVFGCWGKHRCVEQIFLFFFLLSSSSGILSKSNTILSWWVIAGSLPHTKGAFSIRLRLYPTIYTWVRSFWESGFWNPASLPGLNRGLGPMIHHFPLLSWDLGPYSIHLKDWFKLFHRNSIFTYWLKKVICGFYL